MSETTGKVTIRGKGNAFVCNYDLGCHPKKGEKGKSIESSNVKKKKDTLCWLEYWSITHKGKRHSLKEKMGRLDINKQEKHHYKKKNW